MKPTYDIPDLPLAYDFATVPVFKALNEASRALAELKGTARTIPNEQVLINTLTIREAQDSSAVENIITTQDELFRAEIELSERHSPATKEVQRYAVALRQGFTDVKSTGLITRPHIIKIQQELERNRAGIRKNPGTKLENENTGEVVYIPPQHPDEINRHLDGLVRYLNDDQLCSLDPLIKMAIIHHQFESIHPFYDGNGRTGRIINILYLVQQELLELPILYLSRYIIYHKDDYYRLLQAVRDRGEWEAWVVYMLRGIETTAKQSIFLISEIRTAMQEIKRKLRKEYPKVYSQDLLNNIFRHPYTKIQLVAEDLNVHPLTARKYLGILTKAGVLTEHKIGRDKYFVNSRLINILAAG
jgi:Fic family protein